MNDFIGFWKTPPGLKTKEETILALKNNGGLPDIPFKGEKVSNYDRDDRYFDKLHDIRGISVNSESFQSSDFSYINLSYSNFHDCTFENVNFFCSRFHGARFFGCKFSDCSLEGIYGSELHLESCSLKKVCLNSAFLINLKVKKSKMLDVDFSSTRIISPEFSQTLLEECDFRWARIASTRSFTKLIKKSKHSISLDNTQWLGNDGKPVPSPIKTRTVWNIFRKN
ncbi:pentapeptide repeat-containing protein [Hahella sp. CR1]|uniref:pentapeptide repeat-containing protein n=1 Tax=Hahella sp. CR1 TaxID=2992807 RepID=UPI00244138C6|nr:pentapeptide repeat-containing protein [Hahella sp. CR1]MDG9672315.1 pentapeptide repeat-containing protein [Hahella sp. CR1]